jgi:aminomethyltransferase
MAKRTPFYEFHQKAGAKLVEFAGFDMPVQYAGIVEEHLAVRNRVGVFDVTHMGEFLVRGKDALTFLQKMTVNDVSRLHEGKVQYSAMCYDDGGIVDDLLVYNAGDHYMLVVNASNLRKDLDWLRSHAVGDVTVEDVSDATALLAVQGPRSLATLQKLTSTDLSPVQYYTFVRGTLAGVPMIISRTGYTGELGFELYFSSHVANAANVWNAVFEAGKEFGIAPIGLGARDTLRLEMAFCLYGNDIDQTTHPLEAGLGWITKLGKGDFRGRDVMVRAKEAGLKRRLVGFTLPDRAVARHGYEIMHDGAAVGTVTSGTFSPSLQRGIALGYVRSDLAAVGTKVGILIRGKETEATVVATPFVQK